MFPFLSEEIGVERLSSSLKFIELVSTTGVPAQAAEQEREHSPLCEVVSLKPEYLSVNHA